MKKNNMLRRWKSLSVACLMACSLAFAGAAGAHADAAKAPWEKDAPKSGSLTIKKLKDGEAGGVETPVQGAEFTVEKQVSNGKESAFDLKKQQDWQKLARKVDQLNAGTTASLAFDESKKMTTDEKGEAKFNSLEVGVYKVTESKVPAGYSSDVKPFYITIPQILKAADGSNNPTYKYDVEVKPKNKDVSSLVTKKADTSKTVVAGDTISYTIEAGINKTKDGKGSDVTKDDLQGYTVFDDALKDAYANLTDVVKKVTVGTQDLTLTTDYMVDSANDTPDDVTRTRIRVKFTDAGLEKIANAVNEKSDAKVKVDLTFTIKASYDKDEIVNKFGFTPGYNKTNGETQPDPVVPEKKDGTDPNPKTVLRNFQIMKVSAKDGTTALKDAKFKIFASEEDAKKCAQDPSVEANCANASSFGEKSTSDDGKTSEVKAIVGRDFWVVETEAPDGYARLNIPTKVNINENKADDPYVVKIENIPTADSGLWFNLPKTGATGVIIFALAGLALVAAGTAAYLRGRQS